VAVAAFVELLDRWDLSRFAAVADRPIQCALVSPALFLRLHRFLR